MSQMTPEVAKLLEQALSLSVEEQEALADSLIPISGERWTRAFWLRGTRRSRNVLWIWRRARLKPFLGPKFASAIWRSCHVPIRAIDLHEDAAADYDAFDWYLERSADAVRAFDAEFEHALRQVAQAPGPKHNTGPCPRPHKPKT
jgi:hypothetical protein